MSRRRKGRGSRSRPDRWAQRAKSEGYAARSVYKLADLDRRYQLVRTGLRVVDLGCAPGSWLAYVADAVGPGGRVVGIDRKAVPAPAPHVTTLVGDVLEVDPKELDPDGEGFDLVLSDMAPDTTGHKATDQARSSALAERALDLALGLLKPGGHLVVKIFQGPDVDALRQRARQEFETVKLARPDAVRKESYEMFVVALGRRV